MAFGTRGAMAAAAAIGVIALSALAAPAASAAPVPTAPLAPAAAAADAPIRPGVNTDTVGGGTCTSNFIFTDANDDVFIGQAAHCAGTGEATETNGCTAGTKGLGTEVTIDAADGTKRRGTLAYSSWVAMRDAKEADPDTCAYNDFALVKIADADKGDVSSSVPFFGGPTGLRDPGQLPLGELVYSYGNSPLRLGIELLSPKVGVSAVDEGGGRGHTVYTLTPGIPGDSGSGFMDSKGRAFGVLSTLNLAPLPASNGVADLASALAYANAHGADHVELVTGKPFTSTPAGVSPMALAAPAGPALGDA